MMENEGNVRDDFAEYETMLVDQCLYLLTGNSAKRSGSSTSRLG